MTETRCPICKTDSYLNPEMVLFVSPCFHKMCESCLRRHFINGTNKCPECGIELRKINYMSSTFEDIEVEKECRIRRQLDKHFRREEEDFTNPVEYNDYLEEMERLVFELVEYKSDSLIKKRISEYKLAAKVVEEEKEEEMVVEEEIFEVEEVEEIFGVYDQNIIIPGDILIPSGSGGLTKNMIISYLLSL